MGINAIFTSHMTQKKQSQLSKLNNLAMMQTTESKGAMASGCVWAANFWLVAITYQIGLVSKLGHNDAIQRPGKRIDVVAAQQHETCKKLAADDCGCTARETSILPMTLPPHTKYIPVQALCDAELVQQGSTHLAGSKATKQKAVTAMRGHKLYFCFEVGNACVGKVRQSNRAALWET